MVTTIVAFLLVYCYMLATTASAANTCAPEILDIVNGTPSGNRRTCSIAYHNSDVCAHVCTCPDSSCDESRSDVECPGFVGMNLTYECSFEGARLYKYQDGEYRYLNGSSVNYGLLLPEHAGLYECRNSTNHVVHAQNLTVNGKSYIHDTSLQQGFFLFQREFVLALMILTVHSFLWWMMGISAAQHPAHLGL